MDATCVDGTEAVCDVTCADSGAIFTISSLDELQVQCNCSATDCEWISDIDSTGYQIIPLEDFDDWKCVILPTAEEQQTLTQAAANKTAPALTAVEVSISINEEWSDELGDKSSPEYKSMTDEILSKLDLEVGTTINGLPVGSLDVVLTKEEELQRSVERFLDLGQISGIVVSIFIGIIGTKVNEETDKEQEVDENSTISKNQIFDSVNAGFNNLVKNAGGDDWAEVRESSKYINESIIYPKI